MQVVVVEQVELQIKVLTQQAELVVAVKDHVLVQLQVLQEQLTQAVAEVAELTALLIIR